MYQVCKKHTINLWQYLVWICAEIFQWLSLMHIREIFLSDSRLLTDLVKNSSRNTALVLLLPYSILWLYFSWRDKKEQIERLADFPPFQKIQKYDSLL